MKTLSMDLRQRIVSCCDEGVLTQNEVAVRFCVSLSMVTKLLRQRRRTGDIAPHRQRPRPAYKLTEVHRRKLTRLIKGQPDITLEEMRMALGVKCSLPAIHYVLKSMKLTFKKSPARQRARSKRRQGGAPPLDDAQTHVEDQAPGLPG